MIAAASTIPPSGAFRIDVFGSVGSLSGHALIQPTGCPSAVMEMKFSEYAAATGTPHLELGITNVRGVLATSEGGPNPPVKPEALRVSTTRQGGIETNTSPEAGSLFWGVAFCAFPTWPLALGTGQLFSGMGTGVTCCPKLASAKAAIAATAAPGNSAERSPANAERGYPDFIATISSSP
jgi:hypothetical protein